MSKNIQNIEHENMRLNRMVAGLKINNRALTEERNKLIKDNQIMSHELTYFKEYCADLEAEIADMKNTLRYLTSREAGIAFARELLGKPMTEADLAEEKAIADGENHYYKMGTALYGDDF